MNEHTETLPDYWLARPGPDRGAAVRASFDRLWEGAMGSGDTAMVEVPRGDRWRFLCHLAETRGVVLHGSGNPGIAVFEPRQANDLGEFGNQKAVYAAGDGI